MFGVHLILFQPFSILKNGVQDDVVRIVGMNNVKSNLRFFHQPAGIVQKGRQLPRQFLPIRIGNAVF